MLDHTNIIPSSKMARQLMSLLLHLLLLAAVTSAAVPPSSTSLQDDNVKPGCQAACGNVSIPYPFGIEDGCSLDESFKITCNDSIPYLGPGNITLVSINLTDGLLLVNSYIAYDCYDRDGNNTNHSETWIRLGTLTNYKISHVRNKLIAVGCDTIGYIEVDGGFMYWTGCSLFCNASSEVPDDGTCSGIGCCTAPIPKDLRAFTVSAYSYYNHSYSWHFNPCGFAFVTDADQFRFNRSILTQGPNETYRQVTLDWAIMGQSCEEAQQGNKSAYACVSPESKCFNSSNGPGYLCRCSEGFQGNPYLSDGCKDIDECTADPAEPPCEHRCKNLNGSYSCSCPWHKYGDGKTDGSGCKSVFKIIYAVLAAGFGLLVAICVISWVYYAFKKKRMMELKEKFFRQNGGLLLRERHHSLGSGRPSAATKLFSPEELQASTDNYNPSRILGEGGAGTVYRGVLSDQTVVAIKKAKVPNDLEVEQFINEVNILSHINHRNVVSLLGCCLEEQVPLLIYEFVPGGTLSHHIHAEDRRGSLSLHHRLRIAAEVAGALSYLHSAASVPIIHRDVKSTNILLDDNLTAKVSDFGASRLVPLDQTGLVSLVRGTFGYLDPEYFLSGQFTDKSDVYSFGVVLVELLTGENPIDKSRPVDRRNLAVHFTTSVDGGRLFEVMESRVRDEGTPELLVAAAELAKRCLGVKGENRPSMKEVAMELEGLRKLAGVHPWVEEVNPEEAEHLLEEGDRSSAIEPGFGNQYDSSLHGMVPLDIMR